MTTLTSILFGTIIALAILIIWQFIRYNKIIDDLLEDSLKTNIELSNSYSDYITHLEKESKYLDKDRDELLKMIAEQARDISEQEQIIDQLEEDREA